MKHRSPIATGVLITLAVLGLVLGMWLLVRLSAVVVLLLIAFVLATGIDPLIERIHGWRLGGHWQPPRYLAILLVLLATLLVFAGILLYVGSVIWTEGTQLWQSTPEYAGAVRDWIADLRRQYPQIPPLEDAADRLRQNAGTLATRAGGTVAAVFGVLGSFLSVFTVVVLTYYLSAAKHGFLDAFLSVTPPDRREELCEVFGEAGQKMGGWLRGQLILAGIALVLISSVMWALGMPYPMLLGLVGAVGELVPMLGPIAAGVVAVPIAFLTQPTWVALALIAFFAIFSQVEGNWLAPRIMQSQVSLSPLATILALMAGASLLGVVGALLAVPLAAGLRVLILRLAVPAIQEAQRRTAGERDGTD